MPKISELVEAFESRMPPGCAETWDSVGLVCGSPSQSFKAAVIGVDLTDSLYQFALKKKANLIVIHHPPLFPKGRGIQKLVLGSDQNLQTILLKCFQSKIAVYVAHTNFDRCALDGMIQLADDLGGEAVARVWDEPEAGQTVLKKLVTFIPTEHFQKVKMALYEIGCGHIGNYDSCGFATAGLGNFRGLKGAKPKVGTVGNLEEVEEIRFETIFVSGMESVVLEVLKEAHPYEEVAYDIYPVEQSPSKKGLVWGLGYGFVAELKKPISYALFAKKVKAVFKVDHFLTNQFTPKTVKRIAFSPGKGSSFVRSAKGHQVDVFITGEVGYHGSLDAERLGFNIIELGHRESELYFLKTINTWFQEWDLSSHVLDERTQRII